MKKTFCHAERLPQQRTQRNPLKCGCVEIDSLFDEFPFANLFQRSGMKVLFSILLLQMFIGSAAGAQPNKKSDSGRKPASISPVTPSFISFYGKRFLVKSPVNNCNVGRFMDHGSSVELCVDSSGNPIQARP
jgi:hypothetical protein